MTDKYYFRVRRYLRKRGEQELDNFEVHCENNIFLITKWNYPNHPRPSSENLASISIGEVDDEIEKTPSVLLYTSDIYEFVCRSNNNMQITANRENYCSNAVQNEIHLIKPGFYRITISGEQKPVPNSAYIDTEINIIFKQGQDDPTTIYTRLFIGGSKFNLIQLLSINGPSKLTIRAKVIPSTASFHMSGNVLVEFL